MDSTFLQNNRNRLLQTMDENAMAIFFSGTAVHKSADAQHTYVVNRNFFYLTGLTRENFVLLLTKQNGVTSETLYIEQPNPLAEKWTGRKLRNEEACAQSGIVKIEYVENFATQLKKQLLPGTFQNLYLDLEQRDLPDFLTPALSFARDIQQKYPGIRIHNAYAALAAMRTIKSAEEVDLMRTAIDVTQQGIENMLSHATPGMHEYELEAHFNYTLRKSGIRAHAFGSIIASGANATVLHYDSNDQVANDGSMVLIDLGAQYGEYNADISRTFPVNGIFTDRQKQLYNIVLKAQLQTIAAIRPGIPYSTLNDTTKRVLSEELKAIDLISEDEQLADYYYHGVSHYLGLDTHDVGEYHTLQPGMVVTVEPGLYIAEEGIGIRIEDDVLVTENGHENLSAGILKTVEEIERFMASSHD